ncbi:MAG: long-chain fatty acid--CoA ligase, partial [Actinomycetota bacterium]|nr:long-chain fatty acid--CoA ligase [Actinomycetota bacterium]
MPPEYIKAINDPRTLGSLIDALVERGEKDAVLALQEEGSESWSYSELAESTRRLAHGLTEAGVSRGDHVMLFAPSQPEWVAASLAIVGAGA